MSIPPLPIPDSYWVIPGQLLAGRYPGASSETETRLKLTRFLDHGINHFTDLTQKGDILAYQPHLEELAAEKGMQVDYQRFPISDLGIPADSDMIAILDWIDAGLQAGRKVYVHCFGGLGRTGVVVGCYLVRHGMTGGQALERIAVLRRDMPGWWMRSPEMEDQREMVLSWQTGK